MSIGSLFSGIGGLELGLEWAGLGPVLFQVERDPYAKRVLAKHWPDAERFDDVRAVGAHNLPFVDVLCGGFPCQDLSYAGKGAGLSGARSGLWTEFARIIGEIRPRIVVVENVAALLSRGIGTVLSNLAAIGYDTWWDCIPASSVGATHRRDRLFVVAMANPQRSRDEGGGVFRRVDDSACRVFGEGSPQAAHAFGSSQSEHERKPNQEIVAYSAMPQRKRTSLSGRTEAPLAGAGGVSALANATGKRRKGSKRKSSSELAKRSRHSDKASSQSRMGREPDGLSVWMDRGFPAAPGYEQFSWEAPRTATDIAERANRLRCLGNAVVPQVAYVIGRAVVALLQELAQEDGR